MSNPQNHEPCNAETSGEGYWTCNVEGGCPGCYQLAIESARTFGPDEALEEWQAARKAGL